MSDSVHALIYARESKFEARAGNRSPEEQINEGVAWCAANGREVIEIDGDKGIIDAGIGASRHSRGIRKGWERARRIIAGEEPGIPRPNELIVWASSRATRKLDEYVELRNLCAEHGVHYVFQGRVYDLSRREDRLATGMFALVDEHDVDLIKEDVQRALRANVTKGRPHAQRPFGYRRVYDSTTGELLGQESDPTEAPIVRTIYRQYLSGVGVTTIADRLNAVSVLLVAFGHPGIYTAGGERIDKRTGCTYRALWSPGQVTRILRNPAYVGKRTHHGEVFNAGWESIIDEETWERTQARRDARAHRGRRKRQGLLLSGVAVCSVCGDRLSRLGPSGKRRAESYTCRQNYHVSREAAGLDAWVTAAVLERFKLPDVPSDAADTPDPVALEARARVAELRDELNDAMALCRARDAKGRRKLSVQAYAELEQELLAEIEVAERTARRGAVPLDLDLPDDLSALDEWWEGLGVEQCREVIAALVDEVVVYPVGRGRQRIDWPACTKINWRR